VDRLISRREARHSVVSPAQRVIPCRFLRLTRRMCACFAVFGIMLLILAALSVIWHSSNAPDSQYVDLWSMDSCIAYLIVRIASTGVLSAALHAHVARGFATEVVSLGCAALFGCVVVANGLYWRRNHRERWLHGGCPFSGRARLQAQISGALSSYHESSGYLHDSTGAEMHTIGACLYLLRSDETICPSESFNLPLSLDLLW
jgi:hypothetical protein